MKIMTKVMLILSTLLFSSTLWAGEIRLENTKLNIMGKNGNIHGVLIGGGKNKTVKSLSINGVMRTEIHMMKMNDGMMSMYKVKNFSVPKNERIVFKKGGLHIMLMGISKKLKNPVLTINFTDNTQVKFTIKNLK